MRWKKFFTVIIMVLVFCSGLFPATTASPVYAASDKVCKCTIKYKDGTTEETEGVQVAILGDENGCACSNGSGSAITNLLLLIIDIMTIGVGILGVIGISIVGITYLTAGGDVAKTTKAKSRMFQLVLGVVIYVGLWAIAEWLLPGGMINNAGSEIVSVTSRLEDKATTTTTTTQSSAGSSSQTTSTVKNQYAVTTYKNTKNGLTFNVYHQEDEPWGSLSVNGNTVGQTGCNLIAAAVVVSGADSQISPKELYDKMGGNSWTEYYVQNTPAAAAKFSCQATSSYTWEKVKDDLAAGKIVTAQTSENGDHYIAMLDINDARTQVYIGNTAGTSSWAAIYRGGWVNLSSLNSRTLKHTTICTVKNN